LLNLSGGVSEFQAGLVDLSQNGMYSRWFSVQNGANKGGGSGTIVPARQNAWHTVTTKLNANGAVITGATVNINSGNGTLGNGNYTIPATGYGNVRFGLGIYEGGAPLASDVYYDNVRCR
jgi:hypothetical protein